MIIATRVTRPIAAVAAALVCSAALAQEIQNAAAYTSPDNSVSIGAGVSSGDHGDRTRFGLFNGMRENSGSLLFDFNYSNRDANSGRWMIFEGRNIGLDNRELGFTYRNLGDFKLKVDYGEITRHDPRIINTSLQGAGTTTPTVSLLATPGTGQELNLDLKRKGLGFELQKMYGNFQLEVTFKNEDKKGARLWGTGFACSVANYPAACSAANGTQTVILMLPEPVDSTIRQFEAKLNYNGPKLKLSGGYYGNFYINDNGSMTPGILGATIGTNNGGTQAWNVNLRAYNQTPIALWPDSQAHQFYLGGNYALTSHTKVNFKLSHTRATQNENFGSMGLFGGPAGRDDLGGKLNTTRAQAGFSSHPWAKVHVHGDVMYESKQNKTPLAVYNTHATYANTWTNSAMSPSKFESKLEGSYKFPYNLVGVIGAKYEHEDFGAWTPTDIPGGINGLRQKLDILGYRIELRKTMSETFSGSVGLHSERRDGASPWLKPYSPTGSAQGVIQGSQDCVSVGNNGCVYNASGEFAFTQEDMQRDKLRAMGNWAPMDRLSLQATLDLGSDRFRGPTTSGMESATMYNLSLDGEYQLTDNWKLRAFATGNQRTYNMQRTGDFQLRMKDSSSTLGVGFTGTPLAALKVGGDLTAMRDTLRYGLTPLSVAVRNTLNATGGLPDVKFTLLRVNLYGEYTINKSSSVRLDFIHHRTFFNEWTYDGINNGFPYLFSDNTTISAQQRQSVNFIGARYVYRFQ